MLNNRTISIRSRAIALAAALAVIVGRLRPLRRSVSRTPGADAGPRRRPPQPAGQAVSRRARRPPAAARAAAKSRPPRPSAPSTWRSRRSPSSSRSRPSSSKTSTCSIRNSRSRAAISRRPNNRVYLRSDRRRACRLQRHAPSGLRRRNPLGLPARPRLAVLPQAEHQADPGTAQFARARSRRSETRPSPRWAWPARRPCWSGCARRIRFDHKEEDELDGRKVWKFHGTWRNRQGLVGPDAPAGQPDAGVLPPYIPMDATLYLGKDDGWPYKLDLEGPKAVGRLRHPPDGPGRPAHRLEELDREDPPQRDHADLLRRQAERHDPAR